MILKNFFMVRGLERQDDERHRSVQTAAVRSSQHAFANPAHGVQRMAKKMSSSRKNGKRITRKELDAIERAAKREAQKAAGALDGRFRPRVVKSKKRYTRKRPPPAE
jgi:hypothetical protein